MRMINADALIESICWDECGRRRDENCDCICPLIKPIMNEPTIANWMNVENYSINNSKNQIAYWIQVPVLAKSPKEATGDA